MAERLFNITELADVTIQQLADAFNDQDLGEIIAASGFSGEEIAEALAGGMAGSAAMSPFIDELANTLGISYFEARDQFMAMVEGEEGFIPIEQIIGDMQPAVDEMESMFSGMGESMSEPFREIPGLIEPLPGQASAAFQAMAESDGMQAAVGQIGNMAGDVKFISGEHTIKFTIITEGEIPSLPSGGTVTGGGGPPRNQFGGSYLVGGVGGPDSQLVQLAVTPGERIDVHPPGAKMGGGGGNDMLMMEVASMIRTLPDMVKDIVTETMALN